MLKSRKELLQEIANFFKQDIADFEFRSLTISSSMTSNIEDGLDGSIFRLHDKSKNRDFIVKMKSQSFVNNVGQAMNYTCNTVFEKDYEKGYGMFYIRDSYIREKFMYGMLSDSLRKYLPTYYGTIELPDETCLHLIELLEMNKQPIKLSYVVDFLVDLHCTYWQQEDCIKEMNANIPTLEDYVNAIPITEQLLKNISVLYDFFEPETLEILRRFAHNPQYLYKSLCDFPQTLCQGDFNMRNITFYPNCIKSYDWELATYNNPTFDIVSFLVDYPTQLNQDICDEIFDTYTQKMIERMPELKNLDWKKSLHFNIILFY